jgi:hypothetical protein
VAPAVSHAVWDIGQYDKCANAAMDRHISGKTDYATLRDEVRFCCERSGGEWSLSGNKCEAPAAAQTDPTTRTLPPVVVDGGTISTRPSQATTRP